MRDSKVHLIKKLLDSDLAVFILFLLLGFAVYFNSLGYGFILDDISQVVHNPAVHQFSEWYRHFQGSTMASENGLDGIYYKPVMMLIYSALWNLGGGSASYFHYFQLLVHCLNAFLLFRLLSAISGGASKSFAFFVSLIFLVHPINSEAVLFIADLQEPLYTLFGLLALNVLAKKTQMFHGFVASFFLLLALLSKESGLLYLLVSVIYLYMFQKNRLRSFLLSISAVAIVYLVLRFWMAQLTQVHSDTMLVSRADLLTRLLTMPEVLAHYIVLYFFPKDISLTQDWVVSDFFNLKFLFSSFLAVSVLLGVLYINCYRSRDKLLLFFSIWFLLGWGLHSQVIPLDGTVSDRWFYFTIIGFTYIVFRLFGRYVSLSSETKLIACGLIVLSLALRSQVRALDWRDELTLYGHDIKIDPDSFYLNNNLGLALMAAGNLKESLPYFEKTLAVSEKNSTAWFVGNTNRAAIYMYLHDYARAEEVVKQSLNGRDVKAYRLYAWALKIQGKDSELDNFLKSSALIEYPSDPVLNKFK